MPRRMFECQSCDCPARRRVRVGGAVALEMIEHDETFRARFECAGDFVEFVKAGVGCEIPLELGNDRSGGRLSTLDDRLAGIDCIHIGAPHTRLVNFFGSDAQMKM